MQVHTCPDCRRQFTEDEEQDANLAARVAALEAECVDKGYPMRDGLVSEEHAAMLLGKKPKTLAGWRKHTGKGPMAYRLSVNGSWYSYSLTELAAWEAMQQLGESWI
jgi:hypothetical protein